MDPARLGLLVLLVIVVLAALAVLAVGWHFSDRFVVPEPYSLMPEFEVVASAEGTVTLPAPPPDPPQFARTRAEGVYNLLWEGGYGRLGSIVEDQGTVVTRELRLTVGRSPEAGDPARMDATVYRRDPLRDHGIPFEEVRLAGEAGELVGWWIPGGPEAVLVLHGRRRADRTETLRVLPVLVEMGHSVLVLSWRNHDGSSRSRDGLYRYGAEEYRDALTGVAFLQEQRVERVAIFGFSTGATLAVEALERWPDDAPEPVALLMDSPLVDLRSSVRASARSQGLPDLLSAVALSVASLRTGVRWSDIDMRQAAERLAVPVWVAAGTADGTVPIQVVDDFVGRLRAPVTYLRLPGVEHVEAWNADPQGYASAVRAFLSEVMPSSRSVGP